MVRLLFEFCICIKSVVVVTMLTEGNSKLNVKRRPSSFKPLVWYDRVVKVSSGYFLALG